MTNKRLLIVRKILSCSTKRYIIFAVRLLALFVRTLGVGDVKVTSTSGDVRYCHCSLCGATLKQFVAKIQKKL